MVLLTPHNTHTHTKYTIFIAFFSTHRQKTICPKRRGTDSGQMGQIALICPKWPESGH